MPYRPSTRFNAAFDVASAAEKILSLFGFVQSEAQVRAVIVFPVLEEPTTFIVN